MGRSGTQYVALCHVVPKYIVICAIVRCTRCVDYAMIVYGLRLPVTIARTLSLLFFFLWHKKKSLVRENKKETV